MVSTTKRKSWKEFFKPTKSKIILFLIFLLFPIIDFFEVIQVIYEIKDFIFAPVVIFHDFGSYTINDIVYSPKPLWTAISIILGIIWAYLLSCLIIFIYEKFKRKSKRKK